jgi:two-component system, chemotaxis family, chemotaxis protein CheY
MDFAANQLSRQVARLKVLIVDDEPRIRKVARVLLQAIGIRDIHEANDGRSGLDAIRRHEPDIALLDWEMPSPNGPEFMRAVRSPGKFPMPDVPVIMLTGHGERSRVVQAMRLGVNEYLLKPVSSSALLARIISIIARPRRMLKQGDYYGPEPRNAAVCKSEVDADSSEIFLVN